jgi:hypothetical protein
MENKLSANEWMKTILDNQKKLKWTTTPLDQELLKLYHSKTSDIKVLDGSSNPSTKLLFERVRQRDDTVIILLQLLPTNSNMFFKINWNEYVNDGRLKFHDLILTSKYGETLMNKSLVTSPEKFQSYLEYHMTKKNKITT